MLDVEQLRTSFPVLATEWALFDNAGGSAPHAAVIDAVSSYMRRYAVQLGASYDCSTAAARQVARGREAAAILCGADADEVTLHPSSTVAVALLSMALRGRFAPGDRIVVTNLDHECNIGAWSRLAEFGVEILEWRLNPETCQLDVVDLKPLLGGRTRLVCFTHCSNIVGLVHDAASICDLVHQHGALACVDGVAFAPHRRVDVREIGADIYFASYYKIFGPHLAYLYVRRELADELDSVNHHFIDTSHDPLAAKIQPGGVTHELVASLPALLGYLLALGGESVSKTFEPDDALLPGHGVTARPSDLTRAHLHVPGTASPAQIHPALSHTRLAANAALSQAFSTIAAHELQLAMPLLAMLERKPGVRVLGGTDAALRGRVGVPTIAFSVEGRHASEIAREAERDKIAIRWGHFYAYRAVEALGLHPHGGVVRVSMAHYNTTLEVERVIDCLHRCLAL